MHTKTTFPSDLNNGVCVSRQTIKYDKCKYKNKLTKLKTNAPKDAYTRFTICEK